MAGSDGSIIIDTELDSSGFKKGAAELQRKMNNLVAATNKIGRIPFDSARFSAQVNTAKDSIAQLQTKLEELGNKTFPTAEYETATKSIEQAEKALGRLYDRQSLLNRLGVDKNSNQWRSLRLQIQDAERMIKLFTDEKKQMEASGTAFISGAETEQYKQLSAALQEATEQLRQFEQAKQKASRIDAALSGMKKAFQNVGNGIKAAVASLKKYVSHSKSASSATSGLLKGLTSLKTMLFSRVKRMFISYIFNEMKEAMNALQQYDKSFGTAMNNMKNAAKGLSANLAVSFGGLISAIEPVLTKIINAISTAISYINALFALLGGKSTVTVAKKQMDDYANAAGGAGKKVEELKRQVYSFDELNKRSKDSDSGGGGGGANAADLFEEVPIDSYLPDSVRDFFERIKAAFEAGDWEGIGSIIAEGLNTGMGVVDRWITGTLQPLAFTWSERIARVLNGLVSGTNWDLMGNTVADGLNTAFGTIDVFLTTFDFDALGNGFGNGINGIVNNVRWDTIGATLVDGWNGAVNLLGGTVAATDWGAIGEAVSTGMQSITDGVSFPAMGSTLSDGVRGVLTGIYTAIETFRWEDAGANLYKQFVQAIQAIDWAGITSALFRGVGAALGGLAAFTWGIIQEAWADVAKWFKDTAYEDGQFTMEGLLQGIWDGIKGIGSWIKTNIYDPFINGFCSVFGINSPSKVMQEQGGFIIDGLLLGITEGWNKITGFFSTALNTLKTGLENAWNGVKTAAGSAWNAVKTAVTNPFDTTKTTVGSIANSIKTGLSTAWNNVKTTASTAWNNVKTAATTPFNNMKSTLTTGVSSLRSSLSTGWNSISTGATQSWSGISSNVTTKWNALKSTLHNTNWATVGSNICTGIGNGINSGWSWLTSRVSSLASSLLSTAKRALGIHSPSRVFRDEIGENIGLGLAEGIENSEKDVNRSVAALAKSTVAGFNTDGLSVNVAGSEMISGLDRVAGKLSAIADTFRAITSMLDSVSSLPVPEIAAGTTVPPKVRAGFYSGRPAPADDGISSIVAGMAEYMADYIRQNDQIIEVLQAIRRKPLEVNAVSVERVLSTYHRNFGGI